MPLTATSTVTLNNGKEMPLFGFGTWLCPKSEPVKIALQNGYIHLDTAIVYDNHKAVRKGIDDSGVPIDKIFITSKIWCTYFGSKEDVRLACEKILEELGLPKIDLILLHFTTPIKNVDGKREPFPVDEDGNTVVDEDVDIADVYTALEECHKDGLCDSIGVSNFDVADLEHIIEKCSIVPQVNQIERHLYFLNDEVVDFCKQKGIHVTAYCPLGNVNPKKLGTPMDHCVTQRIALRYKPKTPAQLCLRWGLQRGVTMIPKSEHESRIKENIDIFDFEISDEDMATLNGIGLKKRRNCNPRYRPGGQLCWPDDTTAWDD